MTGTAAQVRADLPEDWQITTIGDVTEKFLNGGTPSTKNPEYWEGIIPWTTSSPMTSYYLDRGEYTISREGLEKSASNLIPKNNVLISTRVGVGKVAINRIDIAINQDLTGLILDKTRITPDFFVWTMLSKEYNQKLRGMSRGTTIKGLIRSELERFTIPLPPLPEQRRIATILTTVDDAIQHSLQAAVETERLKAGMMQELMAKGIGHTEFREDPDVGRVPKKWEVAELKNVMDQRSEIIQPTPKLKEKFVGLEHIETGESSLKRYDLNADLKSTKSRFYRGDILYGKLRPYLDKAAISGFEGICSTDLLVLTPRQEKSIADFLINILHSHDFIQYAISTTSGTNHPRTSWKAISEFRLGLPALTEQKEIATILNSIDHKFSLQHQRTANYEQLKQGLMNELLTGRRRVKVS